MKQYFNLSHSSCLAGPKKLSFYHFTFW